MVNGSVNVDEGHSRTTAVLDPVSELVVDVFGPERGSHARTAIGVSALPTGLPVAVSARGAVPPVAASFIAPDDADDQASSSSSLISSSRRSALTPAGQPA